MDRTGTAATVSAGRIASSLVPLGLLLSFGVTTGMVSFSANIAMGNGVPPVAFAFWQALGAALLLLMICRCRGLFPRLDAQHLRYYFVSGAISLALPYTVIALVVEHLGTGLANALFALSPTLTYLFASCVGIERVRLIRLAGVGFGFAGCLAIILSHGHFADPGPGWWLIVAMLIPVSIASGNVYRSLDWPRDAEPQALAAGVLLASATILAVVLASTETVRSPHDFTPEAVWAVIGQSCATAIAYLCCFKLQKITGPVYLSQAGYIIVGTGIFFGMFGFGEAYSGWFWLAVLLMFTGISVVTSSASTGSGNVRVQSGAG